MEKNSIHTGLMTLQMHHKIYGSSEQQVKQAFKGSAAITEARDTINENFIMGALTGHYLSIPYYTLPTLSLIGNFSKEWRIFMNAICKDSGVRLLPPLDENITIAQSDIRLQAKKRLHHFYRYYNKEVDFKYVELSSEAIIEHIIRQESEVMLVPSTRSCVTDHSISAKERIRLDYEFYEEDKTAVIEYIKSLGKKSSSIINYDFDLYPRRLSRAELEKLIGKNNEYKSSRRTMKVTALIKIRNYIFKNQETHSSYLEELKSLKEDSAALRKPLNKEQRANLFLPLSNFKLSTKAQSLLALLKVHYTGELTRLRMSIMYSHSYYKKDCVKELLNLLESLELKPQTPLLLKDRLKLASLPH